MDKLLLPQSNCRDRGEVTRFWRFRRGMEVNFSTPVRTFLVEQTALKTGSNHSELCSKGSALGNPLRADYEDISKVFSFIESRLVVCFLRMKRPDPALPHSHRRPLLLRSSIQPSHMQQIRTGLAQAGAGASATSRKPPETTESCLTHCQWLGLIDHPAVKSAMIADYVHWLSGEGQPHISKLIKLYWQGLLEEALTIEEDFSALYTPCSGKLTNDMTLQIEETFRKLHPTFTAYIFTDPQGVHVLPQTTDWSKSSTQSYVLTLGFRRREDGDFLNKLLHRKCPVFTVPRAPFSLPTPEHLHQMCETCGKRILPVLDFIKCTKLTAGFSAGSGLLERLQFADCLRQLRRIKEHREVLQHMLAELALAPYLQEMSPDDTTLLQALMADTMDTLEGKRPDQERVWNAVQKVGLIEDMLYQWEETYLKKKALRAARRRKVKAKNVLKEPKKRSTVDPVLQRVPQILLEPDRSSSELHSVSSPSPPSARRTPDTATHLQREPPAAPITPL
ncbi:spermatogenesis-associated protein 16-like [Hoplias malabaricus]|uniref:spermatogenesis-associated protein 16-like n=1 Tax=Hoplias malabaricus TaxID=27720 RepID=UPI003462C2AE